MRTDIPVCPLEKAGKNACSTATFLKNFFMKFFILILFIFDGGFREKEIYKIIKIISSTPTG
jgi:hypothetical protein